MDRDEHAPTATQADHGLTRRGVMRKTAIGIGAAATMGGGAMTLENGPVQESEALAPLVAGGFLAGVAIDWALREYNVYGSDTPPEGLTAGALEQDVYETARTRISENASTLIDNQNILDGVEHTAYTDAKIAAIEALNAGSSESDVLDAANTAIDSYFTTIESNLLKSWNESVLETEKLIQAVLSHSGLTVQDVSKVYDNAHGTYAPEFATGDSSVTLSDGSTFALKTGQTLYPGSADEYNAEFSPLSQGAGPTDGGNHGAMAGYLYPITATDNGRIDAVDSNKWIPVWDSIQQKYTSVSTGISTWVTNVYGSVQSGEIEITDLITPREQAAMMTEDGKYPQAVADLIALNIPVDLEREATVSVPATGTTLRGTFALTDSADGPLSSGETYDPATFAGDAYLTTDISLLEGTWSAYQTAVDGGVITLSEEPYEGVVYEVETTAGEIASVAATDWTDSGTGTWTYDASADLETPITEVAGVSFYAETTETQYETILLDSEFTIEKFMNTETGEEETSAMFTSSEPQDDTNYITQEEWNTLEQQNQELIEKYEESKNSGGGGGGLLGGGLFQDTKTLGIVAGGAALAALLFGGR